MTDVAPDFGARLGGTRVTITGTGFTPGTTVKFGSSDATAVTFVPMTGAVARPPEAD